MKFNKQINCWFSIKFECKTLTLRLTVWEMNRRIVHQRLAVVIEPALSDANSRVIWFGHVTVSFINSTSQLNQPVHVFALSCLKVFAKQTLDCLEIMA